MVIMGAKEHARKASAFFLLCFASLSLSASTRPNVLFLVVDDLRPSLGCYGESIMRTGNIDNLAAKSVLFEQAYAQQAFCGPSRTSFLTSRRPDTTRLYDLHSYWRVHAGNYTTLPQHFKEHGYITQSVGKVFHPFAASNYSDDMPYSWTNTPYHPPTQQYKMSKVCPNPDGKLAMNIVCPVDVEKMPGKSLPDIQSADFAVDFLKNISKSDDSKPFFLAVGFHKPHVPLKYPKQFRDLYPLSEIDLAPNHTYPSRMPLVAWNPWTDVRSRDDVKKLNVSFPFGPLPDHFQKLMRQSYYAATSYMDTQVGRVLEALDHHGFAENTIITFNGDHGWALGERQEWSKYSVYNVATRVPLLVYIPGVTYRPDSSNKQPIFPYIDPFLHRNGTSVYNVTNFDAPDPLKPDLPSLSDSKTSKVEGSTFSRNKLGSENPGPHIGIGSDVAYEGYKTKAFVELVDLFPTLAEIANLPMLPKCPVSPFNVMLCTEGTSLLPLIKNITSPQNVQTVTKSSSKTKSLKFLSETGFKYSGKNKKLPKYKRMKSIMSSLNTLANECANTTKFPTSLDEIKTDWMKPAFNQFPRPSVVPLVNSDKPDLKDIRIMGYSMLLEGFHYIEWVGFTPKNYTIAWDNLFARELYLRDIDPFEVLNMALYERCYPLRDSLSKLLQKGWRYF